MKILIAGARGLMGREAAQLANMEHECLACSHQEMDILSPGAIARVFENFRPHAVLHCAAYTDVDGAEREPSEARRLNVDGARNLATAASKYDARLLYLSTDYVFDGSAEKPYEENMEPNPLSIYAKTKLEGELAVQEECPSHVILRTGWLYGSGKGFVDWLLAKLSNPPVEPVGLVEDQFGSPTSARELARAMLRAVDMKLGGIFHFVNKGTTNWLGLGRAVAELTGRRDVTFRAISHQELERAAPRPRYSSLCVDRYEQATGLEVVGWREALEQYLRSVHSVSHSGPSL